jgi:hypothetical protein
MLNGHLVDLTADDLEIIKLHQKISYWICVLQYTTELKFSQKKFDFVKFLNLIIARVQ